LFLGHRGLYYFTCDNCDGELKVSNERIVNTSEPFHITCATAHQVPQQVPASAFSAETLKVYRQLRGLGRTFNLSELHPTDQQLQHWQLMRRLALEHIIVEFWPSLQGPSPALHKRRAKLRADIEEERKKTHDVRRPLPLHKTSRVPLPAYNTAIGTTGGVIRFIDRLLDDFYVPLQASSSTVTTRDLLSWF
jgi:hypothetical protein